MKLRDFSVHLKKENAVIIYSFSCPSKPTSLSCFHEHKQMLFGSFKVTHIKCFSLIIFKNRQTCEEHYVKGVVHFKKKTFADNSLTPMSSKISMSFFLQLKRN